MLVSGETFERKKTLNLEVVIQLSDLVHRHVGMYQAEELKHPVEQKPSTCLLLSPGEFSYKPVSIYRFSISNDLKFDAERDLKDIDAPNIPVHALNKVRASECAAVLLMLQGEDE